MKPETSRSETTTYAKKFIIRWIGNKRRTIVGSAHGLDRAIALARQLTPPPGTNEILITQGLITQWRDDVHV